MDVFARNRDSRRYVVVQILVLRRLIDRLRDGSAVVGLQRHVCSIAGNVSLLIL